VFGYIRPFYPELKLREYELYRAAYCGLCNCLGKRYGIAARIPLAYDLIFLTLIFSQGEPLTIWKRCPISLKKRRCLIVPENAVSAAVNIILAYHKLRDDINDEHGFRRAASRTWALSLRKAYAAACVEYADYDRIVRENLKQLQMSQSQSESLDSCADAFAMTLTSCADVISRGETEMRCLRQLLYHIGRFIYIIDARDDLAEDTAAGRYNSLKNSREYSDHDIGITLNNSLNLARSAFELMPETAYSGIIRNILYLGLNEVMTSVFAGTYNAGYRLGRNGIH